VNIPVLNKLLTSGTDDSATAPAASNGFHDAETARPADGRSTALERRVNQRDRRAGISDWRAVPTERRGGTKDRRKKS
jgi:hypothetical protein